MKYPITIDFETYPIEGRPNYPPTPVGVSIKKYGCPPRYYAWGHPSENNCSFKEAKLALEEACFAGQQLLFHNAKFDVDVLEVFFGIALDWKEIEDTLILAYLYNPHQNKLGLKVLGEKILKMPPEERDIVVDWLIQNKPKKAIDWLYKKTGKRQLSDKPDSPAYAGAYVAFAPGGVVGAYANGDVERTEKLWTMLYADIIKRDMGRAYDRERELLLILLDMERNGIPVDLPRLESDVEKYQLVMQQINSWLYERMNCGVINLDSGKELVNALINAKLVDLKKLGITPKSGKPKTNKDALSVGVNDKVVSAMLQYRSQLKTCLSTFMENWLRTAKKSNGYIYTYWHQVRGTEKNGTKTGRLSSTPNFQNISNEFKPIFAHEVQDETNLPICPLELAPLPKVRGYIVPPIDYCLIDRDFSQQEPRILAHFEAGPLLQDYLNNPWIDFHDNTKQHVERIFKRKFDRKPIKNIGLGLIYAEGAAKLAIKNNQTLAETKELKEVINNLYPGVKEMYKDMKKRSLLNIPYRTWGGREYYCEPPSIKDGKYQTYDYRMVNGLVQGSAADCTKEAIIRFYHLTINQRARKIKRWFLYLNVHDQLVGAVPKKELAEGQEIMRQAMESVEFDLPILSEGVYSFTNWADTKQYDKKGKILYNE